MLEVRFLGQFEVLREGRRLNIPTRNAQSLFAYLALNAQKAHRREKLAGLLWPDSSDDNARSNLRHELWRLRKALEADGESCFEVDDLAIQFNPPGEYFLDVSCLEKAPSEARPTEDLIESLSAYQGELLPGFYDEWVFVERQRLAALFETRIARLLELLQTGARWPELQDWSMRWIALGQMPEPAYRALMTAYASTGDVPKAVATYERYTQALQKELGVKPSEPTQALYKRLKSGWKMDAQKVPTAGTVHLTQPASTATFSLPMLRRSNLPKPLTSFIGREKEIQQVRDLVSRARLVTITGPGGVGKTRLAIQVGESLKDRFNEGVWWVELAALFKPAFSPGRRGTRSDYAEQFSADLIAQAIAKTLHIQEIPGQTLLDVLIEYLESKQLLLVLDNCEHLIEDCADLAERLLSDCPGLSILTTSREALGVPGEKAWLLPSLSLPGQEKSVDFTNIRQSEAVRLFVERAGDILPAYQPGEMELPTIAQVCLRLDGIPLAIELAAARINLLSTQELSARLDQRFSLLTGGRRTALPRHQTLRAAIEWSYDLLSQIEQVLLRRLSIFASSFTLEAAEAVCSDDEIRRDLVFTLLGRLVDKSLLKVEPAPKDTILPTRYRFLDTICSFGRLKLGEAEETRWIRDRHAAYYVCLIESVEPELLLKRQVHWNKLLLMENDNLRSVIEWCVESDQAEGALRLIKALLWIWWFNHSINEGLAFALKSLALPSAAQFKEARAGALTTAGFFFCLQGNTASARQSLEEAILILRATGDEASLAWSLQFLGLALAYDKEYDQADAAMNEGLALIRKLKDISPNSLLFFLGDIDLLKGDRSRAKRVYEESVQILRSIGSKSFLAYPLRRLGYLALEQNDVVIANKFFQESLALNYEMGDNPGFTASLVSMAALALRLEQPVVTATLYGAVKNRLETLSINLLFTDQAELDRILNETPSYLDGPVFSNAFTEGLEMSEAQALELATRVFEGKDE